MKKNILLCVLLVAVMMISIITNSCSSSGFEDIKWTLDSMGDIGNPQSVIEGTTVTATFSSKEGKISGSAGCNNYFGGYDIKDGLSVGMLASTEMWCGDTEGVMDQELEYLKTLQTAESYKVKGEELHITCGEKVLIYKTRIN